MDVGTPLNTQSRTQLRKQLQAKRRALDTSDVIAKSEAIATHLKPLISPGSRLAAYLALGNEVRLENTMTWARTCECLTFVPIVKAENKMVFAPYHEHTNLLANQFGIREPDVSAEDCLNGTELDTVLVPLVGFDANCQRMGMGGGYYDRAFEHRRNSDENDKKPLLIGIAFDIQEVPSVLPSWWDVPLDRVVTESGINYPAPSSTVS